MTRDGPTSAEIHQYDPPASEKHRDALISLFYVLVFALCGLPMWMATTTTYRASLPEAQMEKLATARLDIAVDVNLVNMAGDLEPEAARQAREGLLKHLEEIGASDQPVRVRYNVWPVREVSRHEASVLKRAGSASELHVLLLELQHRHEAPQRRGGITVLLVPADTRLISSGKDVLVTRSSGNVAGDPLALALVRVISPTQLERALAVCVGRVLANSERLRRVHRVVLDVPGKQSLASVPDGVRSLLTRVRSASKYEWLFSLVVPEPRAPRQSGGPARPEWDFPSWEHLHLEPLVRQLGAFLAVRVSSQLVYGVRPAAGPSLASGARPSSWLRPAHCPHRGACDDLTHLINGLEAYLGGASPNQLHMVVVAPSCQSPLATAASPDPLVFSVPGWGAVLLLPRPAENASSSEPCEPGAAAHSVDRASAMAELLPRLRALMGFPGEPPDSPEQLLAASGVAVEYERASGPGTLAGWQLQGWLRERSVENLAVARAALRSLLVLLDRVATMVIRDEVAEHVRTATERALVAVEALQAGALPLAFLASRQALEAAETAFFHPSLLELLYFQDDQKIGIYIPLFVPVLVPLALAAARALWPLLAVLRRAASPKRD